MPQDQVDPDLANWERIRMVLEDAEKKLTRQAILNWLPDFPVPSLTTLWHWLDPAVQLGLVCCDGTGRRRNLFRYWLSHCEAQWRARPALRHVRKEPKLSACQSTNSTWTKPPGN